ncbi:MAG: tyrosine-type recombinase/integrase [Bacillota bacterium]
MEDESIDVGIRKTEKMIGGFKKDLCRRFNPLSFKFYLEVINECADFFNRNLTSLSYVDLREWHQHLLKKGHKLSRVKYKFDVMKTFFKYCVVEKYVGDNQFADYDSFTLAKKLPTYLTSAELFRLREVTKLDILYRTIIEVLFYMGLRISELINMELKHIDWEQKIIWIPSANSKNRQEAYVPFSATCEAWLKKYLQSRSCDSKYVFVNEKGDQLCRHTVFHKLEKYGLEANIPLKVGPHLLRRTCATFFAAKGAKREFIRQLLRHRNYWSQEYYANLTKLAKNDF